MPDTSPSRAAPAPPSHAWTIGGFTARVLIVAGVTATLLALWAGRHAVLLFFAAVLVACGLRGVAKPLRKRLPIGEKGSIALAGLIILALLGGLFALLGAQLSDQFATLIRSLPAAWSNLQDRLQATDFGAAVYEQARSALQGGGLLSGVTRRVLQTATMLASGALEAFLVLVAGVFLAVEPRAYRDAILKLFPPGPRPKAREALDASGEAMKKWLLGTLFSMAAMTAMVWLGLALLGVPAPLALGLLAGVAQFVPFVGPILAAVPGVLLAFAQAPQTALWAVLMYFIASTIEANILYPLIQKRAVEQAPVLTLFSILAFGAVFGAMGVLLAVPLTVVITIFVVVFYVNGALGEDAPIPGR